MLFHKSQVLQHALEVSGLALLRRLSGVCPTPTHMSPIDVVKEVGVLLPRAQLVSVVLCVVVRFVFRPVLPEGLVCIHQICHLALLFIAQDVWWQGWIDPITLDQGDEVACPLTCATHRTTDVLHTLERRLH